jgi:hypothetical protein
VKVGARHARARPGNSYPLSRTGRSSLIQRPAHRGLDQYAHAVRETVLAHPYHHALPSVKKWGGAVDDYMPIHAWFDGSKQIIADFRHRALRHHAEGIFMVETIFGATVTISTGRVIPVRWIAARETAGTGWLPEPLRTAPARPG